MNGDKMNKPKAFDYMTDRGMHSAMAEWAKSKSKPTLSVSVVYSDSPDVWTVTFERATKQVKYRLQDGEIYTVDVDTAKFLDDDYEEYSKADLKVKFEEYAQPVGEGISIVSMVWKLDK